MSDDTPDGYGLAALLDKQCRDRSAMWGYQVCVARSGHVLADAAGGVDGLGREMRRDSLVAMYCTAKTLAVVVAAHLVTVGEISFDDAVGDLTECADWLRPVTIAELLSHRSGVYRPGILEATTSPPSEREPMALRGPAATPPLTLRETLYTEAAAWFVLAACLRQAGGAPLDHLVRDLVLDPLCIADQFDLAGEQPGDRRRVAVSLRGRRPMPLLLEATDRMSFSDNPGYGGFSTMRGQATVMSAFMGWPLPEGSSIGPSPAVRETMVRPGPTMWDRTFERSCSFGMGFASNLRTHSFGETLSDKAIAQSGLLGMTSVVADPDRELVLAIHVNGLLDGETMLGWLRPAMAAAATREFVLT